MTGRIFAKLILAVVCILVVALVAVDYFASQVAERAYIETLTRQLASKGRLLSLFVFDTEEQKKFESMAQALGGRLTVIDKDGKVLRDSEADPARMENHRNRPEIAEALHGKQGWVIRPSPTLGVPFLYVAQPVNGQVLRLAVPIQEVRSGVDLVRGQMLAAVALAFLPAVIVAAFFARYVSARLGAIIRYAGALADGKFEERLPAPRGDELGLLERKLNETGEKLQHTVEQLHREHVELEKLERVRKDFVINVSHELRTPLASIQGYTETLLDGALEDTANNVKFLSIIRQNAERLGRLTADLLTLSRIELKTQRLQPESYYLNSLVQDCIDSIEPIAAKKRIRIHATPATAKAEVFCDSEAVHQILTNLLDNAIKYTPEDGSIHVTSTEKPDGAMEIAVRDNGIGIPEEDQPRLFERFYRVDKARSRELGGTGLGLAIVKHLVKAMGGEVGVRSQEGQGSTFWFTLPADDPGVATESTRQGQLTAL
ncbi:MAG: HAMP domain-containing protein [Acidobacteria bacterium]|nr:HAMP domain-containing protein [Acidobacteriota bacterium]